jgi:hypothetical protein
MTEVTNTAAPAAPETQATQESTPQATPVREKVKLDGEEVEVTLDELKAGYQRAQVSAKRFQEASAERKKAEELFSKFKEKPWEVMSELGMNPREVAESFLIEQLKAEQEEAELNDDQKEVRRLKKEIEAQRAKEEEAKKHEDARKEREMTEKLQRGYEQDFVKALEASQLPRNPTTIRRMAEQMLVAAHNGYEMSAQEAAQIVEEEIRGSSASVLKDLDAEKLVAFLGKDTIEKIRKYELSKLKNPMPVEQKQEKKQSSARKGPRSLDDFLAEKAKQAGL